MRLDQVLLGIDFTEPSMAAARWVSRHFAPEARLLVLHAIEIPRPPSFLEHGYPPRERLLEVAWEGADHRLAEIARTLAEGRPGAVHAEAREGRAADLLASVAEQSGADLIAVGEPAERAGVWRLLGSTAERLVHGAQVPVLVARDVPAGPPSRILVPVDDSPHAARALAWARFLGARWKAAVTALHAVPPAVVGHVRLVSSTARTRDLELEFRELSAEWLERLVAEAGFAPDEARTVISAGDPRAEILAVAGRIEADLIMMGSRGSGAIGKVLLGSVATGVLRGAACPVLIVADQRE